MSARALDDVKIRKFTDLGFCLTPRIDVAVTPGYVAALLALLPTKPVMELRDLDAVLAGQLVRAVALLDPVRRDDEEAVRRLAGAVKVGILKA